MELRTRNMQGCCVDCGRKYGDEYGFPDLVVPDDVWLKISSTGHEDRLLCPSCLCRRAWDAGITDVAAVFRSGPFCVREKTMNLEPIPEGAVIPDVLTRLPASLEEAVAYVNSKFPFIADSVQSYEEFAASDTQIIRAVHVTYAMSARIEGQDTSKNLLHGWLLSMMNAIIESKRERLYWRLKPEITVDSDGSAFTVTIRSRSSMV